MASRTISGLHPELKLVAAGPAASPEQVEEARRYFKTLPREYLELVSNGSDLEFFFHGKKYLRLWSPHGCVEMDEGYGISRALEGAVPIGDDGGGRVICYYDGPQGAGLYRTSYSSLDPEDVWWLSENLTAFLGAPERLWQEEV